MNTQQEMQKISGQLIALLRGTGASSLKIAGTNGPQRMIVICAIAKAEEVEELDSWFEEWASRHELKSRGGVPFRVVEPPRGRAEESEL